MARSDKITQWAVQQYRDHGFEVDDSNPKKYRITHPKSGETRWMNSRNDEGHVKKVMQQMFKRHGVETEQDRAKRDAQAVKERQLAQAAAERAAEEERQALAGDDRDAAAWKAAQTWHKDHGVQDLALTHHAAARALDMALTKEDIEEAFLDPHEAFYSHKHEAWTLRRGKIALGIAVRDKIAVVLTILWSTRELWVADIEERGAYGDRVAVKDNLPE